MICFRVILKHLICLVGLLFLYAGTTVAQDVSVFISPSQAYAEAVQIEKEVELLLKHFKISERIHPKPYKAELKLRHVFEMAYVVLTKVQILREKNGFSRFSIVSLEPKMSVDSELVYEQTQRILTELRIIKTRLGISAQVFAAKSYSGKRPIDVFNKLHQISLNIELLNHEPILPNHVFAVVMKIDHDVDDILRHLFVDDQTFPPAKVEGAKPVDVLASVFALMGEIQRLQGQVGITRTDFSTFEQSEDVKPSDVFNMVGMAFAELQTIKASLDITTIAPPAERLEGKTPADSQQFISWVTRKLRLIEQLR